MPGVVLETCTGYWAEKRQLPTLWRIGLLDQERLYSGGDSSILLKVGKGLALLAERAGRAEAGRVSQPGLRGTAVQQTRGVVAALGRERQESRAEARE